jgi:Flp pilus assembly pilin Flp
MAAPVFSVKNEKGQSAVEYILLLAVLAALTFSVLRSPLFKDLLGPNSSFFRALAGRVQFSYRHGFEGSSAEGDSFNYSDPKHKTYWNDEENISRFFLNSQAYQ